MNRKAERKTTHAFHLSLLSTSRLSTVFSESRQRVRWPHAFPPPSQLLLLPPDGTSDLPGCACRRCAMKALISSPDTRLPYLASCWCCCVIISSWSCRSAALPPALLLARRRAPLASPLAPPRTRTRESATTAVERRAPRII